MSIKRIVYLDNASSSFPKPKAVAKAAADTINLIGANPGRSSHDLSLKASRIVFEARMALAQILGLANPERIIFTGNATEGINLALKGLLKRGDRVAISRLEHNAVMRPLHTLKKRGVLVEFAECDENGLPDPAKIPDVKMLVTVAASNVTGAMADIGAIGGACAKKGVMLMVDAAQTAGSSPLDVSNVDVLACPGHKGLLGPQGTGFIWFRKGVEPATLIEGGAGSDSESVDMPKAWPDRHEAGTLNTPGVAGLGAAAKYLAKRTVESIRSHETGLCRLIMERLGSRGDILLYPPYDPEQRANLVSFNIRGMDPAQVGERLNQYGIASRVGLHCAPQAHRFIGTFPHGAIRVSPGAMTTKSDIDKFLKAINKVL